MYQKNFHGNTPPSPLNSSPWYSWKNAHLALNNNHLCYNASFVMPFYNTKHSSYTAVKKKKKQTTEFTTFPNCNVILHSEFIYLCLCICKTCRILSLCLNNDWLILFHRWKQFLVRFREEEVTVFIEIIKSL